MKFDPVLLIGAVPVFAMEAGCAYQCDRGIGRDLSRRRMIDDGHELHIKVDKLKMCKRRSHRSWICAGWWEKMLRGCVGKRA